MFYVLSGVYNAWFASAVWAFIWGAFMTKTQIGISDSITFAVGFLVELPSGVMADIIGRKKTILLGNIMLSAGNLLIAISSSFFSITLWYMLWTIGYAFQSGATEALAYDSLKEEGYENNWKEVITTSTIIGRVVNLSATAIGGALFAIGLRLPYLTAGMVGIIGVIAAYFLKEIVVKKPENTWSPKLYLTQIKDGLAVLINPKVVSFAFLCLTILSIGYMYNWGILRPFTAERFGYTPTTYAYLLSVISFSVIISLSIMRWIQKWLSQSKHIIITTFIFSLVFLLIGLPQKFLVGGTLMILLAMALTHVDILFSQFINEHTPTNHRATTLSAIALFTRLPYVLLALVIGKIAENNGLPQYTVIVGVIGLSVWALSFLLRLRKRYLVTSHYSNIR